MTLTKLTDDQCAIIGAFTGVHCGNFPAMREYIETLLERPVFTHELADKELVEKIKELAKPDFIAICQ